MTGLAVLDVFISLVFIYLLYSLLAMTVIESITSAFSSRSKNLITGIDRLLADDQLSNWFNHTVANLFWVKTTNPLTKAFYAHPAIKYLGHKGLNSKPSYIGKDRFGSTLIDLLRKGAYLDDVSNISATLDIIPEYDPSLLASKIRDAEIRLKEVSEADTEDKAEIEAAQEQLDHLRREHFQRKGKTNPWEIEGLSIGSETKYQLKNLWQQAANDKEKFKALIENWYEEQMDRIAGWYKRKVTLLTFIVGFVIAGFFNVDTISLTTELVSNDEMRTMLVESASAYLAEHPEIPNSTTLQEQQIYLDTLSARMAKYNYVLGADKKKPYTPWTVLGWLITAYAISLGAPFWFDLLNKLMQVRNSVKIPAKGANAGDGDSPENLTIKAVG
ncbi:hypothetical protein J0A68_06635 [Algoriphagus sp. H41]|uniref:Uncharacterized protein n=1 Tax=Algoriphagus oliviformis TaxID=2811231 RepID=A0ABS3C0H7_9BACT|nr:hypothetical protein [Algoriphagus oliviformis]MBN7810622.1 hypothetical protein [Algoriphagus oliviformis]